MSYYYDKLTTTFIINGMTCDGCKFKVKHLLEKIDKVTDVTIDVSKNEAIITSNDQISTLQVIDSLKDYPKYTLGISEVVVKSKEQKRTWWQTYKPVLLIFIYLVILATLYEITKGELMPMRWMNHFMAGFFLVFSFFKMLDVQAFANSYAMYDIVARKIKWWGYLYPFVELGLGILLLFAIQPVITNWVTLFVMSISLIGVLQSVYNKKTIQCACLGTVFNLPMSTVTIIEDGLMIVMSIIMLLYYYY